eukprot:744540_1
MNTIFLSRRPARQSLNDPKEQTHDERDSQTLLSNKDKEVAYFTNRVNRRALFMACAVMISGDLSFLGAFNPNFNFLFHFQLLFVCISSVCLLTSAVMFQKVVPGASGGANLMCAIPITVQLLLCIYQFVNAPLRTAVSTQYIIIIFTIVTTLLFVPVIGIRYLHSLRALKRHHIRSLIVLFFFFLCYLTIKAISARRSWPRGILGRARAANEACPVSDRMPYIEFLPPRTMNFFVGRQICSAVPQFSELSATGVLTVDCTALGKDVKPSFSIGSDAFEGYDPIDRKHEKRFENILGKKRVFPYTEPVDMVKKFPGVTCVSAFCGERENFHILAVPKPDLVQAKDGDSKNASPPTDLGANLSVLFFDAVSRLHAQRRLKRAFALLATLPEKADVEVFQFFRYSTSKGFTTANNYYPGIIASSRKPEDYFWKPFKDKGFTTAYVGECCEDQVFEGVSSPSLDHEALAPFCHPEYSGHGHLKSWSVLTGPYSIAPRCIAGKYTHSYVFDYIRRLFKAYPKGQPMCSLMEMLAGHEGSGEILSTVDEYLESFLRDGYVVKDGLDFSSTITVLVSDHGSQMTRLTKSSEAERRHPLLMMIVPKKFLRKFPELGKNLRMNQQRLVHAYDVHTTLQHITTYPNPPPKNLRETFKLDEKEWAQSLFEPISADRTCEMANILPENCICDKFN